MFENIQLQTNSKELVQFSALFLEEKQFVNLFSSNWWGYNSKYRDTFNLENYAIYRLLCSFTDRFRNNSKYIFFINQWIKMHKQYTWAAFCKVTRLSSLNQRFYLNNYSETTNRHKNYKFNLTITLFNLTPNYALSA